MTPEPDPMPSYRTQLAGSLSALVNLWWSPTFRSGMVQASGEDVGVTEARLLWELGYLVTARPNELAARMEIGAPSITKTIARLRERGLVAQTISDADRRGRIVSLTDEGQLVTQRLYNIGDTLVGRIVANWEPSQVKKFTEMVSEFVAVATAVGAANEDIVTGGIGR